MVSVSKFTQYAFWMTILFIASVFKFIPSHPYSQWFDKKFVFYFELKLLGDWTQAGEGVALDDVQLEANPVQPQVHPSPPLK